MHILQTNTLSFKYSLVILALSLVKFTYCHPSQQPCLNGGVLVAAPAAGIEHVCLCNKNFAGQHCEFNLNSLNNNEKRRFGCQLRPCWIGSTCEDRNESFVCHCSANTFGEFCEQSSLRIDNPCVSKPCYNDGRCIQQDQNSYTCSCQGSYGGNSCKQNLYGACASNPCQRDGICVPIGINDYKCQCPDWTIGKNCEVVFNPCSRVSCQNGGNCLKKRTLAFECNCSSDFVGLQCDQARSETCLARGCRNGACRLNQTGQYACACDTAGYTGALCEVDQCSPGCQYGKCNRDDSGNFFCACFDNYKGQSCSESKAATCFAASSYVETEGRGQVRISELRAEDRLKTYDEAAGKWIFSKFITYLHADRHVVSQYISVRTSANRTLLISPLHYIARLTTTTDKLEFVFAKNLKLNNFVITDNSGDLLEYITHLENVYEPGAYAPLTESGTLAVNSIYASCYANVIENVWAHWLFQPVVQASRYFTSLKFYDDDLSKKNNASLEGYMFWYARFFFKLLPYIPFSSSLVYF